MYAAAVAVLRVVTTPLWGRILDRVGIRPVLVVCTFGAMLGSLSWFGPGLGFPWLIALDALVSGLLLGGQELAFFTLPLAVAPRERRPLVIAASLTVSGLAFGLASMAGGVLVGHVSFRVLLVLSAVSRLVAGLLALRMRVPGGSALPDAPTAFHDRRSRPAA